MTAIAVAQLLVISNFAVQTSEYPAAPFQYTSQVDAMANLTAIAKNRSAEAREEVLALLSSDRFRLLVNQTCPALGSVASESILQRLQDEVSFFIVYIYLHVCLLVLLSVFKHWCPVR